MLMMDNKIKMMDTKHNEEKKNLLDIINSNIVHPLVAFQSNYLFQLSLIIRKHETARIGGASKKRI